MDEYHQELVLQFVEMCGCDFDIASDYLRCCDWSIDAAISLFFENGGSPLSFNENITNQDKQQETEKNIDIPALCQHCEGNVKNLSSSTLVYKEECVYCYSSLNEGKDIDVCLSCYLGFCSQHTQLHSEKTGHSLYLRIQQTEIIPDVQYQEKITKLAIGVEGGLTETPKQYETHYCIYCSHCNQTYETQGYFEELAQKILLRSTGEKEKELFRWEEENLKPCPHCESYKLPSPCPSLTHTASLHCADCELSRNLWLCLECGEYHCGRKQWDVGAAPGNGHAIEHFKKTGHSLVVKVASIQENHADVHCYSCDEDPRFNYGDIAFPSVFEVLTKFGVIQNGKVVGLTAEQQEKTITEMNLLVNQEFEFSMNDASGKAYEPYSQGCGLENLGNSCYMNSVMQLLMHMPAFTRLLDSDSHWQTCSEPNPTNCLTCQIIKFIKGYLPGKTIKPRMLKQVIGMLAGEFDNNKQQDCYEFFTSLSDLLSQKSSNQIHSLFSIKLHYSMECLECHHRDKTSSDEDNCMTIQIPNENKKEFLLSDLLLESMNEEYIEKDCEICNKRTVWSRIPVYEDFPEYLCVRINRFIINESTYSILKNTASVNPDNEIEIPSSLNSDVVVTPPQKYVCVGACLHRGNKADFGHYVAVLKEDNQSEWILCNDSKVVVAGDAPVEECYLVFYKKNSIVF